MTDAEIAVLRGRITGHDRGNVIWRVDQISHLLDRLASAEAALQISAEAELMSPECLLDLDVFEAIQESARAHFAKWEKPDGINN